MPGFINPIGTRNQDAEAVPSAVAARHGRYLIVFAVPIVLAIALVAAVFAAARMKAVFGHFGTAQELVTAWKVEQLGGHDADVVVIGDSTGLVGVVPKIIEQDTGLSGYNLCLTVGSFVASGTDLLDAYLRVNRAPKVIVLYLNPWTTPSHPDAMISQADRLESQYPSFESTFALDKVGNVFALARYLIRYPEQAVTFVRTIARRLMDAPPDAARRSSEIADILAGNAGWLPFARGLAGVDRLPALPADCSYAVRDVRPDPGWFASFRRRYATDRTRVLVILAPIPDCDRSLQTLRSAYSGLVDLPPAAMAGRYFVRDMPRRSHLLEAGAAENTHIVAAAVERALAAR